MLIPAYSISRIAPWLLIFHGLGNSNKSVIGGLTPRPPKGFARTTKVGPCRQRSCTGKNSLQFSEKIHVIVSDRN